MTQRLIIESLILLLSLTCVLFMFKNMLTQATSPLTHQERFHLITSGVIAFFMDTIGVGSFACNIALAKYFRTFRDEELPAMVNGAQVIPGVIGALFFLGLIQIDGLTLSVMILGTCLGGVFGASIISKLNPQAIRLLMLITFPVVIFLILSNQFHWLPVGGEKIALQGHELILGFIGLFIAGTLTSAGVGLFAMVQAILFCLGMSPLVAFPIMTAAGALQQPLSTGIFVFQNKVPLKKTMYISIAGIAGVLLAIPVITHLNVTKLHFLLVGVLSYNTVMMGQGFFNLQKARRLTH